MTRFAARILGALLGVLLAAGCGGADWQIDPAGRSGPITLETSAADLVDRYGAERVRATDVPLGEGESAPGIVLFPEDSTARLSVLWADSARTRPAMVVLTGRASRWSVGPLLTLGTPLDELHRRNGRHFLLAGFGWDYGGTVISWEGGELAALEPAGGRVVVRLSPPPTAEAQEAAARFTGDREYRSDVMLGGRVNPLVYELVVVFPAAASR